MAEDSELRIHVTGEMIAREILRDLEKEFYGNRCRKLLQFPGGDYYIKKELLSLTLRCRRANTFVEVFGGGGLMCALVPREKFKIIVYNDKSDIIVAFFKTIQREPERLAVESVLIPSSRKIHNEFTKILRSEEIKDYPDFEKAKIFFYVISHSMFGKVGSGFWVRKRGHRNLHKTYLRKLVFLKETAKSYLDVSIENRDFRDIIPLYDNETTLFYCDPPFLNTRIKRDDYYPVSFTESDFNDLLNLLSSIKGSFILKLSGDHLSYDFINEFVQKCNVLRLEKPLYHHKDVGVSRRTHVLLLVYNF